MKIDLSETKPVYELHIWNVKTKVSVKYENANEAIEAYHKIEDCGHKILMEYAGEDGDVLLEYSRGDPMTNKEKMSELSATEKNRQSWWGQDATRILDYIEMYRGNMSDFEVLEDVMCGSYVDHEEEVA